MKVKHVMSIFALSALMGLGAFAGAKLARKEVRRAEADADTWMFNATFKATDYLAGLIDEGTVMFRCGIDGQGGWKEAMMYPSGVENIYNVNVTFADDFTFNRIQVKFQENGSDKYSVPYTISGSKESHQGSYNMAGFGSDEGAWDGGNWKMTLGTYSAPCFKYNNVTYVFEEDIPNAQYVYRNFVVSEPAGKYYTFLYRQYYDCTLGTLTESTLTNYFSPKGWELNDEWCVMAVEGTYDVFLKNNGDDGGIIEFKLHAENETYIYYVLENNTPTNDYIYTWGAAEQFGAWPGTKVTEVTDVQEVTGDGVLHFQGSETPKLIYKIPVTIGYPSGDEQFKLNNGKNQDQEGYWASEERPINSRSAYWYTGSANGNAAAAIDFLVEAERIRNLATDYSVCNISKSNAEALVNTYNSLGTDIQETYVDCSKVLTHKKDKTEGDELVSYRDVMLELSRIAGVALNGVKPLSVFNANNGALLVVVISAGITVIGAATLLTLKKRKHQ